jgi:hypothetical protein
VVVVGEALADQALGDLGGERPHFPAKLGAGPPHFLGDLRLARLDQPRGFLARLGRQPLPELAGLA